MSLKFLNEGFELSQFNVLQENVVKQITSILNTLNEATMSDEDKRDSKLLRQILSKASDASYDKRRALKWTPQELEIADKYNLTLPQRTTNWDGSKEITPLKDNDVDYGRGFGRNKQVRTLQRDIQQATGMYYRTDANMADFIRKRKERGPAQDRPYRQADKYARVDDVKAFGDTTFTHDNSGRFGQDRWDKEKNRPATLAGGPRDSDLTDVEKDRVAVNKQMSQPVRDMKAALADRKANQKDLDNVNLNYARNVADARRRFDDEMKYAEEQRQKESERGQQGVADANSRINKLLKKENYNRMNKEVISEALDSLKKRLVESYEDFDEFYDDVWQKAMDSGIEVVDYDIQGREGTTWVRFDDDDDVFTIDESELVDGLENVFNTTRDIDDAIEVIRDVATPSMSYNEGLNRIRAKTITLKEFLSSIRSYLRNINEAEMSDEDRHDSDILAQIYKKSVKGPRNFKLSPEEKEVLKKFGLKRGWLDNVKLNNAKHMADWYYNVVTPDGEPIFSPYDSNDQFIRAGRDYKLRSGADAFFKPDMIVSDKINYADRARKRPERSSRGFTWSQKQHRMDKDDQDYRTFDQAKDEKRKSSYPYSESINEAKGGPRLVTTLDVPDNFNTNLWKKYHLSKDGQTGEYLIDVDHLFDLIHTYRYDNWPRGEWDIDHMKRIRNQAKHEIEFGVPDPNDKTTSGRWDRYGETPEEAIRNIDATLAGVAKAEKDLLNRGEQRFGRKFKDIADLKYYMDNERYGDFYKIDKSKVTRHL